MALSATTDLATEFGRWMRNRVPFCSEVLGYSLSEDSKAAGRWSTSSGGEFFAGGVGKSIIGRPAHLALIDDPVAGHEAADSEAQRESLWTWYQSDFMSRLEPGAAIILIMTRWHEDDLAGRILNAQNGEWKVIELPALAGSGDPLGREPGEALWPDRWPREILLDRCRECGGEDSRVWNALYQQRPRALEGTIFKAGQFLDENGEPFEWPVRCDSVFAIIDTAAKTGNTHDGTAVTYFCHDTTQPRPLLVLDWDITQITGDLLIDWLPTVYNNLDLMASRCGARWGSAGAFIEDKSTGIVLLQAAERRGFPVEAIDSKLTRYAQVGKTERAIATTRFVEAKQVGITRQAHEKRTFYKGRERNHFWAQVTGFQVGQKGEGEDDLLDTFCHGTVIALE